jgi:cysteine sulfinate desulfinase
MSLPSPWRRGFPGILARDGEDQTYLDSAATAQKLQAMLDAQDQALELPR